LLNVSEIRVSEMRIPNLINYHVPANTDGINKGFFNIRQTSSIVQLQSIVAYSGTLFTMEVYYTQSSIHSSQLQSATPVEL
jgi:hypothetical protein